MLQRGKMSEISVIVPTYKTAKYLPKCLDSILNQTFQDFELIIVSDGPEEDNKICEEYARKDNRISLIKEVNKGLGGARNAGLNLAKGKYIAFVDSDDWIEKSYLEKMYQAIVSGSDVDIVQCGTNIVFEGDTNATLKTNDEAYFGIDITGKMPVKNNVFGNMNVGSWNKLYKKDLIEKYNIRFPENSKNEDAYFTWAYWSVSRNMYCIEEKLYNYLRRQDSLMAQTFAKNMGESVLDHLKVGELFYKFLLTNELFEKRKEAFFNAYYVCWQFVQSNGSEEYRRLGHQITREFLKNKKIPKSLIAEIARTPYEKIGNIETPNSFIENIFSIKNDTARTHKVITLCGVKFKIKRKSRSN